MLSGAGVAVSFKGPSVLHRRYPRKSSDKAAVECAAASDWGPFWGGGNHFWRAYGSPSASGHAEGSDPYSGAGGNHWCGPVASAPGGSGVWAHGPGGRHGSVFYTGWHHWCVPPHRRAALSGWAVGWRGGLHPDLRLREPEIRGAGGTSCDLSGLWAGLWERPAGGRS